MNIRSNARYNAMILVPKEHFKILNEKIIDAPTFAYSILEHHIKGTVLADSANYNSMLIKTHSGLYYATGKPSELLLNSIVEIYEQSVNQEKRFTLFSSDAILNQEIEKRLNNNVEKIIRYAFSFDFTYYKNIERNIVSEYDVTSVNKQCIKQCLEFNEDYYNEYWDSTENFLQNGIGFCVFDKEKIISEAVSIFKSKKYAEVDIITDSNYRGKGLASIIGERFIEYCISNNIEPRWDCDIDNIASINLGNKLGFTNPEEYTIYTII